MAEIDEFARQKLVPGANRSELRALSQVDSSLVNFCSNDYLGLSQHAKLIEASRSATAEYGAGAGASRLVTGNHALYGQLETLIAEIKGTESALAFGSGYLANLGVIPALVGDGDLILADELAHACMMSGGRLSGARTELFRHNDVEHLRKVLGSLRGSHRHCLVLTEGVFSMDGDLAPLKEIAALSKAHDAWLLTDDAHGLGVVGAGRGSAFAAGVVPDIQIGTLSKAVGSYGGFVAASGALVQFLVNRARSFIYSTGLPPGVIAAACEGLRMIRDQSVLCSQPIEHARAFCEKLSLPAPQSAIVPIVFGDSALALKVSDDLAAEGFLVRAIRPPTVPEGTARLRVTFCANHNRADVLRLADVLRPHVSAANR